ncbi:tetratricopeptide repeat protein [Lujinxingia vulgaris]|uniref:Tetratricopeptide repeat protein n=1 Tax=Lujinxingia vulgaris TaxID=2600176 RepID=A0A5C6XL03_9DELT|nr:tetratricopeptide repeat protein [Lujinxingia vulgaris]
MSVKYCPTCKAQFEGEEIFCPHDGTRLLTKKSETPGRLAGSSLHGVVNLEAFLRTDHLGELYRGRMLNDGTDVQVRVFHRTYPTASLARARTSLETLKSHSPLPPQILSAAGLFTQQLPHFIAEELADGDSLAQTLKAHGPLPWREALEMGCKLARALDWLCEQGISPMGVSPSSVYLQPDHSGIQVGGWLLGELAGELPAIDDSTPREALPVWLDCVAPELLRDPASNPRAAAVFSAGALIYYALTGESPLPADATPVQLIEVERYPDVPSFDSVDLSDAPDALVDLLRMSLARDPARRFQAPGAIIAALSNILGSSPDEVAPPLAPASKAVFDRPGQTGPQALPAFTSPQTGDDAAIDSVGQTEPQHERHTMLGMPAVAHAEDQETDASLSSEDIPPRVIIDDPGEGRPPVTTAPYGEGAFDEPEEPGARTAPLNAVAPADEASAEESSSSSSDAQAHATASTEPLNAVRRSENRSDATADASDEDSPPTSAGEDETSEPSDDEDASESAEKKTLMMTAVSVQTLADEVDAADKSEAAPEDASQDVAASEDKSASSGDDAARQSGEATAGPASTRDDAAGPSIVVADDLQDGAPGPETDADVSKNANASSPSSPDEASIVVDDALKDEEPQESTDPSADARADAAKVSTARNAAVADDVGKLNIGFVSASRSATTEDVDEGWFSDSEDAWADEALREAQERTRTREKLARVLIVLLLVAAFIAVLVFTQSYEPQEETEPATSEREAGEPTVDLERLEAQYEDALARGALIHPRSNSALQYLTDLKRHAPERYEAQRGDFVVAADEASRQAESEERWQAARDLSGFASQHAPDDAALRQRAEAVQARYVATLEGDAPGSVADSNSEEHESAAPSPRPSDDSPKAERPRSEPTPKFDAEASYREGRQAYARGDFDAARAAFERTLSASPNHAGANAGLGQILFDQANMRDAERYQLRAVQARPDNIEYRLQLGTVYFRLERFQDAIRTWEEVLNRDPNNSDAQRFIELAQRRVN